MNHENNEEQVTYFGETDARNRRLKFGIKKKDRAKHLYAIGKTGMGKSTLLENLAVQDIINGEGVCFVDPHGKSADLLLEYVPEHRIKDVIYFAPFDTDYPISFNVMEDVGPEQRYLVASGLMSAFKKIWVDAWSARMEYILGNIMLGLLEYPGSTLVGVNRMLTDKDFRKEVVNNITDPSVKSFWVNEYASYTDKFAAEAAPAIQNKVGQFIANPLIRNVIGQAKSSFDIREVMDNKKILIINLSKGRVGEANANLLGAMLITKIYLGAMSRADLSESQLAAAPNFYLYVDEFQSFANESFADILSEARKYKLNLHIAHQYIEQMTDEVRAAVFGNVGTMCVFRVGAYDAEVLEKEFAPYFTAEDIVNLQKYQMYLKLMIDGVTSQPFSASGMSPIPRPEKNNTAEIIASSRSLYARPRDQVEAELLAWIQKKFGQGGGGSGSSGGSGGGNLSGSREGQSGGNSGQNSGGQRGQGRPQRASQQGGNSSGRSSQGSLGLQSGGQERNRVQNIGRGESRDSRGNRGGKDVRDGGEFQDQQSSRRDSGTSQPVQQSRSDSQGQPISQSTAPTSGQLHPISVHQSQSGLNNQPQPQTQNQNSSQRKEEDFRKAISLSYLKAETSETKPEKKPKPENVAALREALLSVMGEANQKTENSTAETVAHFSNQDTKKEMNSASQNSVVQTSKISQAQPVAKIETAPTDTDVKQKEIKKEGMKEVDQNTLEDLFNN